MSDIYEHKIRKARKQHRCECCGKKIEPGKKYSFEKWLDHNTREFVESKLCVPCYCATQCYFGDGGDYEEFLYSDVHEYLYEKYCKECDKEKNDDCECPAIDCPIIQKRVCEIEGIEYEQT